MTKTGARPTLQTVTSMAVISLPNKLGVGEVSARLDQSRAISVIGEVQAVVIGSETLAVAKVSYTGRGANRSRIKETLLRVFEEGELIHVTTPDVVRHL